MRLSTYAPAACLATLVSADSPGYASCKALTSDEINSAGNNSLFTRWRPKSHFIAPAGWMNDPCAPMYDPIRDEYHLFYQWHPNHVNWGNISWGYATSKDLVTWTDHRGWVNNQAEALVTGGVGNYNGLGIFSGTGQPVNLNGKADGTLLLFYTSVSYLPTNWQIDYHPYTETQSIAMSEDGGKTWKQYENNPIINATTNTAPMDWNITGFRDPFVEPWPEMDALLEVAEPHYYAVFGSGIKEVGPRIPLWSAPASDLTNWTFLGALWEPETNTSLGPMLSTGSYAFNFEVSGFFSLYDRKGQPHYYVNMGSEGGNLSWHQSAQWALWNEGKVTRRANGSAEFTPIAGGAGDWWGSYALTSFNDTKHNRRVQWGWAKEDIVGDGGLFSAVQQGYTGALAFPRELFVHEVDHVVDPDGSLAASKSAVLVPSSNTSNTTFTAQTLGIRPLPDVIDALRSPAARVAWRATTTSRSTILSHSGSPHMNLRATIHPSNTTAAGLIIGASPDGEELTTIAYHPTNHTILVDRSHSSLLPEFNNATVTGYFHPYTITSPASGDATTELITFDVYVDGSLVEVYVNDRFAMTVRTYPAKACSVGFGLFVGAGGGEVEFEAVESWVGLRRVWPGRPRNSSSPLVFDSARETGNYTWWTGV